jgi:hypothetical protein
MPRVAGPLIEAPLPWDHTTNQGGGFHTPEMQRMTAYAVQGKGPTWVAPRPVAMLNALQAVPWQINTPVLLAVRAMSLRRDFGDVISPNAGPKPEFNEAFTPEEPALTVSEISRRTGLHVATASRLVAELASYGFLTRGDDRRVRVGMRLWELATRASPSLSLRNAAMPFMEGVHDVVGHHVQLGVLDGDEVLFLERLTAPGAVVNYTRIAGRLPLHASSSGLVLLAHGPADLRASPRP